MVRRTLIKGHYNVGPEGIFYSNSPFGAEKMSLPSMWEWNITPSSLILFRLLRLNT